MTKYAHLQRVLYVEDEPDIQALARVAVETVDELTVKTHLSGDDALCGVGAYEPGMIPLDVMMSGMDEPGTLAALRTRTAQPSTPVTFVTAEVRPTEVANFKSLDAFAVIAKPFDPMTIMSPIQSIWSTRHG